jgi:hypothetical protein
MNTEKQRIVRATLASKCAIIRISSWFSLSRSRASVQKRRRRNREPTPAGVNSHVYSGSNTRIFLGLL